MQAQQALLKFTDSERHTGDRLLKLAAEADRVEGYSEPHATLIARLSEAIGAQMGMHGSDLTALKFAALAHDIGERVMKRNYLLRPDALTWEETLDLWRHPILGEQAAGELKLTRQVQLLIRWHHEWWNGMGYPDGLAGGAIPLGARILRAVDTYCSLIASRPHRGRFIANDAEQMIADLAGIEFDPQVVKLLLALLSDEKKMREPAPWNAPPEPALQVVLTPDGLQAAIIEPEPELSIHTSELICLPPEPELYVVEPVKDPSEAQDGLIAQTDLEAEQAKTLAENSTAEFEFPIQRSGTDAFRMEAANDFSEAITSELPGSNSEIEIETKPETNKEVLMTEKDPER